MLTVEKITELIVGGPASARGASGLAEAERRFAPKGTNGHVVPEQRQLDFLTALGQMSPAQTGGYQHPANAAQASAASGKAEAQRRFGEQASSKGPLAPADVAWVSGLPAPDQVTYTDAVALCRLASQVEAGSGDERLVMSKWGPVKARHDAAAAEAALSAARQSWPAVPEQAALEAMVAALEREPEVAAVLSEQELRARARDLVGEAVTARDTARRDRIEHAERQLATVQRERAEREALTA